MLPRTYLSFPFPWSEWKRSRLSGGLFGGFENAVYWRDGDDAIPAKYDEQISSVMGLWDDGERLVLITWMDIVTYPSWDLIATYWDRSSGSNANRIEINFSIMPVDHRWITADEAEIVLEDVGYDFLGESTPNLGMTAQGVRTSGSLYYVNGVSLGRDGAIWAIQGGGINALTKSRMQVQPIVYGWGQLRAIGTRRMAMRTASDVIAMYSQEDSPLAEQKDINDIYDDLVTSGTSAEQLQEQWRAVLARIGPEYRTKVIEASAPKDTLSEVEKAHYKEANLQTSPRDLYQLPFFHRVAMFNPGAADEPGAFTFASLGVITAGAFLVLDNMTVLLGNPSPYAGSSVPGGVNRLVVVRRGAIVEHSAALLPRAPIALAFEEGTRVWALLVDNTVVCIDYITGEPFAYHWLPLPCPAFGASTKIAWQRDYRRLLVCALFEGRTFATARHRWNTRIVGYSTSPLPVHVCRPIPLRPVRAGRATPFLVRQVGSLGEPLAGFVTLTPGPGVTVARTAIALDESGDAHAWVTASAEGAATLTASIEVEATWQSPGVETPFGGPPQPWVEGS